jgi:hypothetical protein
VGNCESLLLRNFSVSHNKIPPLVENPTGFPGKLNLVSRRLHYTGTALKKPAKKEKNAARERVSNETGAGFPQYPAAEGYATGAGPGPVSNP